MSKVWLNGKISGRELRLLHPLEYEKILEERRKTLSAEALKIFRAFSPEFLVQFIGDEHERVLFSIKTTLITGCQLEFGPEGQRGLEGVGELR